MTTFSSPAMRGMPFSEPIRPRVVGRAGFWRWVMATAATVVGWELGLPLYPHLRLNKRASCRYGGRHADAEPDQTYFERASESRSRACIDGRGPRGASHRAGGSRVHRIWFHRRAWPPPTTINTISIAGRHHRGRKLRYTCAEEWDEREGDFAQTCLRDFYPLGNLKLYYLFDLGDAWTFEIRKSRTVRPPQLGVAYPRIVERLGPDPQQYPPFE